MVSSLNQGLDGITVNLLQHLFSIHEEISQLQSILDDAVLKLTQSLGESEKSSDGMVVALQFHDLSKQLLEHTQARVNGLCDVLKDAHQGLVDRQNGKKAREMMALLNQKLFDLDQRLHRPVRHMNMDSGDIELF